MAYWLMKSEPGSWSWDQQVKGGAKGDAWTGVRNSPGQANLMKMKKGDRAFFYHSGEDKAWSASSRSSREHYPDPTAEKGEPWVVVDVKAVEPMPKPVTLAAIKAEPKLKDMALVNIRPPVGAAGDGGRVEAGLQDGRFEIGRRTMAQLQNLHALPIVAAAIAAWLFGALYYGLLGRQWLAAQGKTMEQCKAEKAGRVHRRQGRAVHPLFRRRTGHGGRAVRHPVPHRHLQCARRRFLGADVLARLRADHGRGQQRLHLPQVRR